MMTDNYSKYPVGTVLKIDTSLWRGDDFIIGTVCNGLESLSECMICVKVHKGFTLKHHNFKTNGQHNSLEKYIIGVVHSKNILPEDLFIL